MPDPNDPTPVGGSTTPATKPATPWRLNDVVAPILAILTVLLTFFLFWYFVHLACTPPEESVACRAAAMAFADAEEKFKNLSTAHADKAALAEARREQDRQRAALGCAKGELEEGRERRAMEKDFILYILGVLSAALTNIFGYYFGSSKGSAQKSDTLHALATRDSAPPKPPSHPGDTVKPERGDGGDAGPT